MGEPPKYIVQGTCCCFEDDCNCCLEGPKSPLSVQITFDDVNRPGGGGPLDCSDCTNWNSFTVILEREDTIVNNCRWVSDTDSFPCSSGQGVICLSISCGEGMEPEFEPTFVQLDLRIVTLNDCESTVKHQDAIVITGTDFEFGTGCYEFLDGLVFSSFSDTPSIADCDFSTSATATLELFGAAQDNICINAEVTPTDNFPDCPTDP